MITAIFIQYSNGGICKHDFDFYFDEIFCFWNNLFLWLDVKRPANFKAWLNFKMKKAKFTMTNFIRGMKIRIFNSAPRIK